MPHVPSLTTAHALAAETAPRWRDPIALIALAFSIFQITAAAFHPFSSQVLRAGHVGFLLLLIYLCYPARRHRRPWAPAAWLLGGAGIGTFCYQWRYEGALIARAGELTPADMAVGLILTVLIFEAGRRVMGWALPLICALFIVYALAGPWLPGALTHRGYGVDQLLNQLAFGTEGFYGTPTYVSATYIFLFILFGAFLEQAGMIRLFTDVALGLFGHRTGGPAKVAVASSALMGTITGSGVANVVTTGQFTIPLMQRMGYRPALAGAIEASASMGSQIMPPVMGAVAFIMAETLNLPFADIAKAALLPACLYFGAIFWMVHLEACKQNLRGLPREQCPNAWRSLRQRWYLLLPLATLVYLLFSGRTPLFSGTVGLALTAIVILGAALMQGCAQTWRRGLGWTLLGVVCAAFFQFGIEIVLATILLLALACLRHAGGRATLTTCAQALIDGARHALPVGIACALVGVILGVVSLTGVATTFASYILALGQQQLWLSLVLTMLTCLVLGMGIPTIPNYIITSTIAAPALLDLGVPLLVSHMFVFYFGLMADLTPPVALACFAAAPIARTSGLRISVEAVRLGIAGFVVPFMAVYAPALLWQEDNPALTLYLFGKAALAVMLWGAAMVGWLQQRWPLWMRLLAVIAGACLVLSEPRSDLIGGLLAALLLVWSRRRHAATPTQTT